jgi:hypothetical protein
MTINIIVSCVKNKKIKGISISQLKKGEISKVYKEWFDLLEKNSGTKLKAYQMYKGVTWNINVKLFDSIKDSDKNLWIVSAGYGFINANKEISSYQSTFQNGDEDSLSNVVQDLNTNRNWWNLLISNPPSKNKDEIRSISHLFKNSNKDDKFIFILSKSYIESVLDDLNSQDLSSFKLPQTLSYIEGASQSFSGSLISLNNQIGLELIQDIYNKYGWDIDKFNSWALSKAKKPKEKELKQSMTDDDVKNFIISLKDNDILPSKTRALKILRSSGLACEQKRFQNLYETII